MIPIDPALLSHGQDAKEGLSHQEEWEYEYDEHQTETFYLTLDLTSSSVPLKRKDNKRKRAIPPQRRSGLSAISPGGHEGEDSAGEPGHYDQSPSNSLESGETVDDNRIQILDLHTANPIISYQNHIYNCSWAATIGTELLITAPRPGDDLPTLVSRPGYSVLAASSVRLVSQSAQLFHRQDTHAAPLADVLTTATFEAAESDDRIPVGPGAQPARRKQARFLEKLMKVKRRKGETDDVTVYAKKRLTGTGWRALRRQQEADDLVEQTTAPASQETNVREVESEVPEANDADAVSAEATGRGGTVRRVGRPPGKARGSRARARGRRRRRTSSVHPRGTERLFSRHEIADDHALDATALHATTPNTWDELRPIPATNESTGEAPATSVR